MKMLISTASWWVLRGSYCKDYNSIIISICKFIGYWTNLGFIYNCNFSGIAQGRWLQNVCCEVFYCHHIWTIIWDLVMMTSHGNTESKNDIFSGSSPYVQVTRLFYLGTRASRSEELQQHTSWFCENVFIICGFETEPASAWARIPMLECLGCGKSSFFKRIRTLHSNLRQFTYLSPTCSTSIEAWIKAYILPSSLNSRVPLSHPKT